MASRPLVLPDPFNGTGGWDEDKQLLWLKVCLTGTEKKTFNSPPADQKDTYKCAVAALHTCYEPESKQHLYVAEFQTRKRKKNETWHELATNLKLLADKAWPTLAEAAHECLALQRYLDLLDNPQVAFAVKQGRPTTLVDAVCSMLEKESYLTSNPRPVCVAPVQTASEPDGLTLVLERLEQLESRMASLSAKPTKQPPRHSGSLSQDSQRKPPPWNKEVLPHSMSLLWTARSCGQWLLQYSQGPGKLSTSRVVGHTWDGSDKDPDQIVIASSSPSTSSLYLSATLNDVSILCLVDTGAAVTLMSEDARKKTFPQGKSDKWMGPALVSAAGTPLQVLGTTTVKPGSQYDALTRVNVNLMRASNCEHATHVNAFNASDARVGREGSYSRVNFVRRTMFHVTEMASEPRVSSASKRPRSQHSTAKEEKLIDAVQKFPCLWEAKHPAHKEQRMRENMWLEVVKVMNADIAASDTPFTIEECQKKWKSLRDQFVRERKLVTNWKSGDPGPPYKPSWELYDLLLFLVNTVKHRLLVFALI